MKLNKVTLKNVGAYFGENTFTLDIEPGKPIILIAGMNGCGKTTLLDFIRVGLYGNQAKIVSRVSVGYENFLKRSINSSVTTLEGAEVYIEFVDNSFGDERLYGVNRSWRQQNGRVKEVLSISLNGHDDPELAKSWAEHIEEIVPFEIAELFFFDGEKIEALADTEKASRTIRTAIYSLLGISDLDKLYSDLSVVQRRQTAETLPEADSEALAHLEQEISNNQYELDLNMQQAAALNNSKRQAEKNLEVVKAKFAREGGNLYQERAEMERVYQELTSRQLYLRNELRRLLEGSLPLLVLTEFIQEVIDVRRKQIEYEKASFIKIEISKRDSEILTRIPSNLIELLREILVQLPVSIPEVDDQMIAVSGNLEVGDIQASLMEASSSEEFLTQMLDELSLINESIEKHDRRLAEIPSDEQVALVLDEISTSIQALDQVASEIQKSETTRIEIERNLAKHETAIRELEIKNLHLLAQNDRSARIIRHSNKAQDTLLELKRTMIERHLVAIETAILTCLNTLLRKASLISKVKIDPSSFEVSLIGKNSQELSPAQLSSGERQLLAISILWGIAKVSGRDIPTIIDTPLGRLDRIHREHLVERYFPYAGNQVLILSTDTEINAGLYESLRPSIATTYTLNFDPLVGSTKVERGYWAEKSEEAYVS